MFSDALYLISNFIFEDIIIPNATSKKINPVLRYLCLATVIVVVFGTMAICFFVGINLLIEDFHKNLIMGIMLIVIGFIAIWYFFYKINQAKKKRDEVGSKQL